MCVRDEAASPIILRALGGIPPPVAHSTGCTKRVYEARNADCPVETSTMPRATSSERERRLQPSAGGRTI